MNDVNDDLLMRVSRRAMACEFEVCFPTVRYENGADLALEALDLVGTLEEQLSFFQPASQIATINRLAAQQPVEVEPWLFDLLQLALRLSDETEEAYDITSAPLWEAWGFARRAGEIPSDARLAEARSKTGRNLVELDPTRRTIRFREPGVRINLGSIGKGYSLDVCADRLLALGMADFLLHGGRSSVLAHGSRHTPCATGSRHTPCAVNNSSAASADGTRRVPATVPWEIGIPNPRRPGQRLGVVRLGDRALGTSGGQFQSFRHRGRRWGHILDPRTGWPAEGVLSATAVAPSAALADALSTAFYVLGPEASLNYCQAHPDVGMIMICPGEGADDLKTHIAGLDDCWRTLAAS